jgi:hypothetical protein
MIQTADNIRVPNVHGRNRRLPRRDESGLARTREGQFVEFVEFVGFVEFIEFAGFGEIATSLTR